MSDCPESGHGHEILYKQNFRPISNDRLGQSGYCKHCGDEVRRIYIRTEDRPYTDTGQEFSTSSIRIFNDTLRILGPEQIARRAISHQAGKSHSVWVEYRASHVEGRPTDEPGQPMKTA